MTPQDASQDDLDGSRRAIIRAARRAAEIARWHNQPLVLWQDGKIVEIWSAMFAAN